MGRRARLTLRLLLSSARLYKFTNGSACQAEGSRWHSRLNRTNRPCVVNVPAVNQIWPSMKTEALFLSMLSEWDRRATDVSSFISILRVVRRANGARWRSCRCQGRRWSMAETTRAFGPPSRGETEKTWSHLQSNSEEGAVRCQYYRYKKKKRRKQLEGAVFVMESVAVSK